MKLTFWPKHTLTQTVDKSNILRIKSLEQKFLQKQHRITLLLLTSNIINRKNDQTCPCSDFLWFSRSVNSVRYFFRFPTTSLINDDHHHIPFSRKCLTTPDNIGSSFKLHRCGTLSDLSLADVSSLNSLREAWSYKWIKKKQNEFELSKIQNKFLTN